MLVMIIFLVAVAGVKEGPIKEIQPEALSSAPLQLGQQVSSSLDLLVLAAEELTLDEIHQRRIVLLLGDLVNGQEGSIDVLLYFQAGFEHIHSGLPVNLKKLC